MALRVNRKETYLFELRQLAAQKHKIGERMALLQELIDNCTKDALTVTKHAVDRFGERIMKMPATKIRKILSEPELLERYNRCGDGKYQLKSLPHCVCVVADGAILTCYNKFDPFEQLELARLWIHECIDRGYVGTRSFGAFKRKFYK